MNISITYKIFCCILLITYFNYLQLFLFFCFVFFRLHFIVPSLCSSQLDMDKSWIRWSRKTDEYKEGLNKFLDFAIERQSIEGRIICPCCICRFKKWLTRAEAYDHLTRKQFPVEYTKWVWHGECNEPEASCSRGASSSTEHVIGTH